MLAFGSIESSTFNFTACQKQLFKKALCSKWSNCTYDIIIHFAALSYHGIGEGRSIVKTSGWWMVCQMMMNMTMYFFRWRKRWVLLMKGTDGNILLNFTNAFQELALPYNQSLVVWRSIMFLSITISVLCNLLRRQLFKVVFKNTTFVAVALLSLPMNCDTYFPANQKKLFKVDISMLITLLYLCNFTCAFHMGPSNQFLRYSYIRIGPAWREKCN